MEFIKRQHAFVLAERHAFWIILFIAFVLRISKLHSIYYGVSGEEYRDLLVVHSFLVFHHWPLLGPSSSLGGFYFGAVYYYIITPFVWLFRFSPEGAVFCSAVFSTLTIVMIYKLVQEWFEETKLPLVCSAFLAISVFDIQNAYYISNPNLLPFFVVTFFYCLTRIIKKERVTAACVGASIAFGVATQLHATALLALPIILFAVWIYFKIKLSVWQFSMCLAIITLSYIPYELSEIKNNFSNLKAVIHLGQGNYSFIPQLHSLSSIANFIGSTFFLRNDFFNFAEKSPYLFFICSFLFACTIVGIGVWFLKKPYSANNMVVPNKNGRVLMTTWIMVTALLFIFFKRPLQPFYFLIIWPLPVLWLGWFMYWLFRQSNYLGILVTSLYILFQIAQLWLFFPMITKPMFNNYAIMQMFRSIISDAGIHKFKIVNNFADVNLVEYYRVLLKIQPTQSAVKTEYLYVIEDPTSNAPTIEATHGYDKEKIFTEDNLVITRYASNQKINE